MIHSDNVINGGASNAVVEDLWRKQNGLERKSSRSGPYRKDSTIQRNSSQRSSVPVRQSSNMTQREESVSMVPQRQTSNTTKNRRGSNSNALGRNGSKLGSQKTNGSMRTSNREFGVGGYEGRYVPNEADGYGPRQGVYTGRARASDAGFAGSGPGSPSAARGGAGW